MEHRIDRSETFDENEHEESSKRRKTNVKGDFLRVGKLSGENFGRV